MSQLIIALLLVWIVYIFILNKNWVSELTNAGGKAFKILSNLFSFSEMRETYGSINIDNGGTSKNSFSFSYKYKDGYINLQ